MPKQEVSPCIHSTCFAGRGRKVGGLVGAVLMATFSPSPRSRMSPNWTKCVHPLHHMPSPSTSFATLRHLGKRRRKGQGSLQHERVGAFRQSMLVPQQMKGSKRQGQQHGRMRGRGLRVEGLLLPHERCFVAVHVTHHHQPARSYIVMRRELTERMNR